MTTATFRINQALADATPSHGRFSCWAGPTGAGVVTITLDDLRDNQALIRTLVEALESIEMESRNGAQWGMEEINECARIALTKASL